jgi:hypothetical protein
MTRKYPNYDGNHCFDYYWQDGNNLTYTNWANSEPQSCANNVLSTVSVNINTGKWYASSVVSIVNNSGVVNWAPLVCKVPAQAPKCVDHVNGTQGFMLPLYNPAYYALTKKCYYNVYVMPENITNGYIVNKDSCASATKDLTLSRKGLFIRIEFWRADTCGRTFADPTFAGRADKSGQTFAEPTFVDRHLQTDTCGPTFANRHLRTRHLRKFLMF